MPRTPRSYDSAFASDAESGQTQNEATSICELSSYEKLNSGGPTDQGEGTGNSDVRSGTSRSSASLSSSDESTAKASNPDKNKNRVSLGGAGRHTKRLVDMKTAAAVATVHKSGSVGAKKVAAAANSTAKKRKGNGGRRSASGNIGSAKKKGSTETKTKKRAAVAAATKKRKKQSATDAKAKAKDQDAAAPKPPASVAMPGRLVRISDYRRRMEPSPISSPIHRVNLTFTPEAMEAADKQEQKKGKGKETTDTTSGAIKKRSAAMVSGGTGRFNIKQE